jgi:hypothetical protein
VDKPDAAFVLDNEEEPSPPNALASEGGIGADEADGDVAEADVEDELGFGVGVDASLASRALRARALVVSGGMAGHVWSM